MSWYRAVPEGLVREEEHPQHMKWDPTTGPSPDASHNILHAPYISNACSLGRRYFQASAELEEEKRLRQQPQSQGPLGVVAPKTVTV